MGKSPKHFTYTAHNAGRDPETGEQRWRGQVAEEPGLSIIEATREAALREIQKLHRDLMDDMRKWKEDQ